MKKTLSIVGSIAIVIALIGIVAFTLGRHADKQTTAQTCSSGHHTSHRVVIQNGAVAPSHTTASQCDRLTIVNLDNTNRLVAFGQHDHHTAYDGIEERLLSKGQSLTVTLDQSGNFRFHDHLDDDVQGTFTVNR